MYIWGIYEDNGERYTMNNSAGFKFTNTRHDLMNLVSGFYDSYRPKYVFVSENYDSSMKKMSDTELAEYIIKNGIRLV